MTKVDFGGLKQKLMTSIVAISETKFASRPGSGEALLTISGVNPLTLRFESGYAACGQAASSLCC